MSLGETNNLQRNFELIKAKSIIIPASVRLCGGAALTEVVICSLVEQVEMLPFLWRCTSDEVVEDVEIALAIRDRRDSGAFKVVVERFDTT